MVLSLLTAAEGTSPSTFWVHFKKQNSALHSEARSCQAHFGGALNPELWETLESMEKSV